MSKSRAFKGVDFISIFLCLFLVIFGALNIYSVNEARGTSQFTWIVLAFVLVSVLLIVSTVIKRFFEVYSPIFYLFAILLLVGVLIFGREINGAKAWYRFGPVSFQPVEFAKMATGLFLANYINTTGIDIKAKKTILIAFAILVIPIMLIMQQPDLGSVIVFSAFFIALYREGFSPWFIFMPLIGGALFLLSIMEPSFYILLTLGFLLFIITICILYFTNNRVLKRNVLGIQWVLLAYFLVLILLNLIFPNLNFTGKSYEASDFSIAVYANPVRFNTYFFASIGFLLTIISVLAIQYNMYKENTEQKIKGAFSQLHTGSIVLSSVLTAIIFVIITAITFISPKVFGKLPNHHQERIMVLFEGEAKFRDTSGYNLLYAKTAIGSGDLLGKGYNQGTVKMGRFVPEQDTDYIFCTVGEEWGFVGSVALVLIYALFIMRLYFLAETQKKPFSRFFGYSVASIFLLHFFINISMVMGLFPTVGIPLPFFSYGGSSLWGFTTLFTIFMILNYRDKQSLI